MDAVDAVRIIAQLDRLLGSLVTHLDEISAANEALTARVTELEEWRRVNERKKLKHLQGRKEFTDVKDGSD